MTQTIREKAKVRQNRDDDRPTEDDVARSHVGPRGNEDKPDGLRMTEAESEQIPTALDPGHTA
jgi:hypothetical protein